MEFLLSRNGWTQWTPPWASCIPQLTQTKIGRRLDIKLFIISMAQRETHLGAGGKHIMIFGT